MYNQHLTTGTVATGGVLATTGVNLLWLLVAGVVLIGAGTLLLSVLPKRSK